MPFLDLDEALADLGYSETFDRMKGGFRVVRRRDRHRVTPEDRKKRKRDWMRARANLRRAEGLCTKTGLPLRKRGPKAKCAPEEKKERKRQQARDLRKRRKMENEAAKNDRYTRFLERLEASDMFVQAQMAAIGRTVEVEGTDVNGKPLVGVPDLWQFFFGNDPHEVAARTDMFCFLRHQGWTVRKIAELFEQYPSVVESGLKSRGR